MQAATKELDIEQVLYLAERMKQEGEDPWQLLANAANQQEGKADVIRWNQCDIAARVAKEYGADSMAKFASDANLPTRRAREYRTMGLFFADRGARAEFCRKHEDVTYSHLRFAERKYETPEEAYSFCQRADQRKWSVAKCEYVFARAERIFGKKPPKDRPVLDAAPCRITGSIHHSGRQIVFEFEDEADAKKLYTLWARAEGTGLEMKLSKKAKIA